jgi:hypothetical protein
MNATDTNTATIQAAVAAPGAHVAPRKTSATRKASSKKVAPKGKKRVAPEAPARIKAPKATKAAQKGAKVATKQANVSKTTKAVKTAAGAAVPRKFSKTALVLDMLKAKGGATMAEIQKATNWQAHSVRGFISGTVGKKMGLAIDSAKNDAGERCYRIAGK